MQEQNDKNDKLCHDQSLQAIQPIFDNRNNKTYILIEHLNKLLNLKMLYIPKFYLLIDIMTDYDTCCQTIFLLIKNRVSIDIQIIFKQINDKSTADKYENIFLQYFNKEKLLNEYQPPICNSYCVGMKHPKICFAFIITRKVADNSDNSQSLHRSDDCDPFDQSNNDFDQSDSWDAFFDFFGDLIYQDYKNGCVYFIILDAINLNV